MCPNEVLVVSMEHHPFHSSFGIVMSSSCSSRLHSSRNNFHARVHPDCIHPGIVYTWLYSSTFGTKPDGPCSVPFPNGCLERYHRQTCRRQRCGCPDFGKHSGRVHDVAKQSWPEVVAEGLFVFPCQLVVRCPTHLDCNHLVCNHLTHCFWFSTS